MTSFALQFSSPEFFAVYFLAFASFVGLSGAQPAKTLVSILLGFAFATVGMDTISGSLRLTFGFDELLRGISFLIVVIGLFGIGELLLTMEEGLKFEGVKTTVSLSGVLETLARMPRYWVALLAGKPDRRLDGHHAGRADGGVLHELRPRQEVFASARSLRNR